MKNVIINIHNDKRTIARHEIIAGNGEVATIDSYPNVNYEFINSNLGNIAPDHILTKRHGNDLLIFFNHSSNHEDLIIKDFYQYSENALIGLAENNRYYYYTPDTGEVEDYVTQVPAGDTVYGHALGSASVESPWWTNASDQNSQAENSTYHARTAPHQAHVITDIHNDSQTAGDSSHANHEDSSSLTPWLVGLASAVGIGIALANDKDNDKSTANTTNASDDTDHKASTAVMSNFTNDSSKTDDAVIATTYDTTTDNTDRKDTDSIHTSSDTSVKADSVDTEISTSDVLATTSHHSIDSLLANTLSSSTLPSNTLLTNVSANIGDGNGNTNENNHIATLSTQDTPSTPLLSTSDIIG